MSINKVDNKKEEFMNLAWRQTLIIKVIRRRIYRLHIFIKKIAYAMENPRGFRVSGLRKRVFLG